MRNVKLTWQPGKNGRAGRWRKKYKGKVYYFASGRGKSDRDAYAAAVEAWETKKREIDCSAPRPHQLEYEKAIETWAEVLTWCRKHGDGVLADEAQNTIESLRRRLQSHQLKPLQTTDTFERRFEIPLPKELNDLLNHPPTEATLTEPASARPTILPASDRRSNERYSQELDGSPLRLAREIWQDRLEVQRRDAIPSDISVEHHVDVFVAEKTNEARVDDLSVGRIYKVKLHLQDFCDWIGALTDVNDITSKSLIDYKQRLLDEVAKGTWSLATARDRLGTVRAFIRWLWRTEVIKDLPRVLDPNAKELSIKRVRKRPVTFTNLEIATLFQTASTRTKLYMLLMLNCGMTQKDISDLDMSEVDWEKGRIIRRRSKTKNHDSVPEVNYLLWHETKTLLAHEWSGNGSGRALLNRSGGLLRSERYEAGKYQKTDNIKNAFDRLTKKTKIKKSLISLKKTSASRLRNHEKYNSVRSHFLGHAEPRLADQHYADSPQRLLDRAIRWLRKDLDIEKLDLAISAKKKKPRKSTRRRATKANNRITKQNAVSNW